MITAPRQAIQAALAKARLIVLGRSTLPILSSVLVQGRPENAWFTITASSLDAQIALDVEADIDEPFGCCIDAAKFGAAIDGPGDTTKIKMDGERVKLTTGRSVFKLPFLPEVDFPLMLSTSAATASLPCEWIAGDMKRLMPFCGEDTDPRPYLRGITVSANGADAKLISTNGHAAAQITRQIESKGNFRVIVPRRVAEALKSIALTRAVIKGNEMLFLGENVQLVSKLIEAQLPDFSKFFTAQSDGHLTTDRKAAIQAVKACASIDDMRVKAVRIAMEGDGAFVSLASNAGAEGRVDLEATGQDFNFGLIDHMLLALLESGADDSITLTSDQGRSCHLAEGNFHAVAMPYRL